MNPAPANWPFGELPPGEAGAILADPPWSFKTWGALDPRSRAPRYPTMNLPEICALPVAELAARDCVLFLWASWPMLVHALRAIEAWGFTYKTCAFDWTKADARQVELFTPELRARMGLGYWTRSNTEPCLLATRGKPKRRSAAVRQPILEPAREHSRKPDCTYARIEELVAGPYVELFARTARPGWQSWGRDAGRWAA